MRYEYPCVLRPEEGGGFYVVFADVRGALTCGDTIEEALDMAEDALTVIMGSYVHRQEDIPVPSEATDGQYLIALPPVISAKLALYRAMREQNISQADLAGKLGITEKAVVNLVNPDYGSHMTSVINALKALGHDLIVGDRPLYSRTPSDG